MAEDFQHFTRVCYELEIGMDREANLIVLQHEALWLLNGMEPNPVRHPDLFPCPPEGPATLFLTPGSKNRKRIVSNQPGGNANYYADGRKTYNPSFRLGRENSASSAVMPQHSSNFTFLPPAFKDLAEASRNAEEHIMGDPRAVQSCQDKSF
jgi:hypothetical protein